MNGLHSVPNNSYPYQVGEIDPNKEEWATCGMHILGCVNGYICTRAYAHPGPHVAHGTHHRVLCIDGEAPPDHEHRNLGI